MPTTYGHLSQSTSLIPFENIMFAISEPGQLSGRYIIETLSSWNLEVNHSEMPSSDSQHSVLPTWAVWCTRGERAEGLELTELGSSSSSAVP